MNTTSSTSQEGPAVVVVYSVALFVVIVLALLGNSVVFVAFYRSSALHNASVAFILSLAVTDILVASISIPIWLSFQLNQCFYLSNVLCNKTTYTVWKCVDVLFSTASIMNLCAISIDKFIVITKPLHYPNIMTSKRANIALAAIWIFAVSLAALVTVHWDFFPTFVFIVSFIFPSFIMIYSYSRIFKTALSQARRVFPIRQTYYFKRELKAAKTLAIVMGTFIACWAPFFLVNLIVSYRPDLFPSAVTTAGIKLLHYINSALNPLIYSLSNKEFRYKILRVLPCKLGRRNNTHMIDRVVFWSTTFSQSADLGNTSFPRQKSLRVNRKE
ncbi:octopamine receptor 1-like [Actinia tenebrosa]|uniref:Octopamine receptor 1-like n=1 Tax=Actinia tenebrosa TaxID=6105 RepID=A0A6P8ISI0_ACTTE|nr:octopamine receptor 1-like [Actinia tenebrosa]